ncbi:MAG: hypothetical protein JWP35_4355 [Caulobacter sp.]|nr:hypothetical protein [Caulobacter sp.]
MTGSGDTDRLLALGDRLRIEGRAGDALTILSHLAAIRPGDYAVLRSLARAHGALGQTLEALNTLIAARAVGNDPAELLSDVREQSMPAVAKFNAHLAANEIEPAERYAAALATLAPHSLPMLGAAMTCNHALGRPEQVAHYARAILALDPANAAALEALGGPAAQAATPADDIAERMVLALSAENAIHPLLRLRDIHDVASAILCRTLTPPSVAQLRVLIAAADGLVINADPGSEWEGWEIHYRLLLKAIDLAAIQGPTPSPPDDPKPRMVTAAGKPIDAKGLRALADRLGVQAVFFAAADEAYVDLYARWYALSVLKYSDVPCLVVVHVIGGADRLTTIAKAVGVSDERLVFASDDFDAGAVTTLCYDSPPKGLIAHPVAHFQSVRFQRLGALLGTLGRPTFVSDIDLLLQRGVADLLERCKGDDLVFNENTLNTNAGSRLTANLLLFNPTPTAHQLLNFLRAYLDKALSGPSVTRWIDQVALIMGRHHLAYNAPNARIGYFDTDSDINNVMYTSYQAHPFRFLSLYHGFDTSSLEGDARVAGEQEAAPKRPGKRAGGKRI